MADQAKALVRQACAIGATLEKRINEVIKDRRFSHDRGPALLSTLRNLNSSKLCSDASAVIKALRQTARVAASLKRKLPHKSKTLSDVTRELNEVAAQVRAVSHAMSSAIMHGSTPGRSSRLQQQPVKRIHHYIDNKHADSHISQKNECLQMTPGGTRLLSELRRTIHLADELLHPDYSGCPSPESVPQPASEPKTALKPGYTSVQQSRMEVREMIRLASRLNDLVLHHVGSSPPANTLQQTMAISGNSRTVHMIQAVPSARKTLNFHAYSAGSRANPAGSRAAARESPSWENKRMSQAGSDKQEYSRVWSATLNDCIHRSSRRADALRDDFKQALRNGLGVKLQPTTHAGATHKAVQHMRDAFNRAYYTEQAHQLHASRVDAAVGSTAQTSTKFRGGDIFLQGPPQHPRTQQDRTGHNKRFMAAVTQAMSTAAPTRASDQPNFASAHQDSHQPILKGPRPVAGWLSVDVPNSHKAPHQAHERYLSDTNGNQRGLHTYPTGAAAASGGRDGGASAASLRPVQRAASRKPSREEIIRFATQAALIAATQAAAH